ncbi:MAG: hypothetical protein QM541_14465 [Flavobacterium sp.]|nr:hypothetical protein [Flavobacterium sp.]
MHYFVNLIKLPPYRNAISINHKLSTDGNEPLLIIADDYCPYYVKNSGLLVPAHHLINEVICHFLLSAWSVPTPEIAFIKIDESQLHDNWGARHKTKFYDRFAFGSKEVEDFFDANTFLSINGKIDFRRLKNPLCFPRIGLFDLWVENDDRPPENLKNLIIQPFDDGYTLVPIDHAFAFRTGAYETLSDTRYYSSCGYSILESTIFRQLLKHVKNGEWYETERQNFYLCIEKSKQCFSEIAHTIPLNWGYTTEIESLIYNFLFNEKRNDALFNNYINYWL